MNTGIFNSKKIFYSFLPVISFSIIASNFVFFFFYLIASKRLQKRKCQLLCANSTSCFLLVFTSKNSIFFFTGIYEILGKSAVYPYQSILGDSNKIAIIG